MPMNIWIVIVDSKLRNWPATKKQPNGFDLIIVDVYNEFLFIVSS